MRLERLHYQVFLFEYILLTSRFESKSIIVVSSTELTRAISILDDGDDKAEAALPIAKSRVFAMCSFMMMIVRGDRKERAN